MFKNGLHLSSDGVNILSGNECVFLLSLYWLYDINRCVYMNI